jgi:hypothetical protein
MFLNSATTFTGKKFNLSCDRPHSRERLSWSIVPLTPREGASRREHIPEHIRETFER